MKIVDLIAKIESHRIDISQPLWVFDYAYEKGKTKDVKRHIPPQLCYFHYDDYDSRNYRDGRFAPDWSIVYSYYQLLNRQGIPLGRKYPINKTQYDLTEDECAQFFLSEKECVDTYELICVENIKRLENTLAETKATLERHISEVKRNLSLHGHP